MRDGLVEDRNLYKILLCILNTLGDCSSDFVGFSKTIAYNAVLVTDYNNGSKAEVTRKSGRLHGQRLPNF